ncbi:hypothetical protein P8C59_004775 [Phyllachora maydis]|uniref:Tafazzin n=1 Tax=Phyllachora maydis TaxID=1825666 RepID=A0AAD9I307_9PEZI|nr:hypothetical protein P8C59_004775 [Phyllachora maydis]
MQALTALTTFLKTLLTSGSSSTTHPRAGSLLGEQPRDVNQRLAETRRTGLSRLAGLQALERLQTSVAPSMPPSLGAILQLPQPTAARAPASVVRVGGQPRLLPPLSSLLMSRHAPAPQDGDTALRHLASDWELVRLYYHYFLYDLPTHLKASLIRYLGVYNATGASAADLKLLLLPPTPVYDEGDCAEEFAQIHALLPKKREQDLHHLDLTGSVGKHLSLRELSDLLFPAMRHEVASSSPTQLQDSWEDAAATDTAPSTPPAAAEHAIPRPLLPRLTHLSLALDRPAPSPTVSWRHLLSLAAHLQALTHLSLAFWPAPSFTPNAQLATVVAPPSQGGRALPYGGTGPYSHSLDDDWAEAVMVLQRLSRALYGLEHVHLTGCCAWAPALTRRAGHDEVDWVGHWGKVHTLVLDPGWRPAEAAPPSEKIRFRDEVERARAVERHVVARRAGRGRFITVETARVPPEGLFPTELDTPE